MRSGFIISIPFWFLSEKIWLDSQPYRTEQTEYLQIMAEKYTLNWHTFSEHLQVMFKLKTTKIRQSRDRGYREPKYQMIQSLLSVQNVELGFLPKAI